MAADTAAREAAIGFLSARLHEMEADYHTASTDTAGVLSALVDYLNGTQPGIVGSALAEVAYAFLAGYEHATGDSIVTRSLYPVLRRAGLWM